MHDSGMFEGTKSSVRALNMWGIVPITKYMVLWGGTSDGGYGEQEGRVSDMAHLEKGVHIRRS